MAGCLDWMSYTGGLLAVAVIGYRIGLGRGRRRERRAQTLNDRLLTAVTDLPDPLQAPRQPHSSERAPVRSKPICLL